MWIPMLAIAVTFINIWLLALFLAPTIRVWHCSAGKPRQSFTFPDQGISLWSLVLLLFTGSAPKPPSPDPSR